MLYVINSHIPMHHRFQWKKERYIRKHNIFGKLILLLANIQCWSTSNAGFSSGVPPIYHIFIIYLEHVQKLILKLLHVNCYGIYPVSGINDARLFLRCYKHSLLSVKFLYGLLHNHVECTELLSKICL